MGLKGAIMAATLRRFMGACALVASAVLAGAPASAADMPVPVKAPVAPVAVAIFNWTGIYIGAHAGGAWFDKDWFIPNTPTNIAGGCPAGGCGVPGGGHTGSSWLAGGQVGFNYQVNQWVLGVEAQFSATKIKGSHVDPFLGIISHHSETDFIATVAGRLGIAWDRALLYVKGGGAWAHDKFFNGNTAIAPEVQSTTQTRWGWMVGGGGEYALSANWSIKLEYNYLDFGDRRATLQPTAACPGCLPFEYDIDQTIHIVKAGINYRFGGPVVARY